MNYLYHLVPENMEGKILYPLNKLKIVYPESYEEEIKKYQKRKSLLKTKIPVLDCLWNDVLHLTAVNPKIIKETLKEIGFKPPRKRWYKIDPKKLEKEKTIIYLYNYNGNNKGYMTEKDFKNYDPNELEEYSDLPEKTFNYYKREFSKKIKPLLFVHIPHILYKGFLNISKLEIIIA